MVRRERLINKLAEIGYVETYRSATKIIEFRQVDGIGRAYCRRREILDDDEVLHTLKQAGVELEGAEEFVEKNQCPH